MADSSVQVRFSADITQLRESIEAAKESLDGLGESFKGLAELAGISLGAEGLKEWIASSVELGEAMERAGAKLGLTASQASELSGLAKLTGTDFGEMTQQLARLQVGLASTDSKSSKVGEALRVMGLDAKEFAALSIDKQVDALAAAFSKFADSPTKTAAAIALLGRAGAGMIPFLDLGKAGMEELRQAIDNTGSKLTDEMAAAFARTNEDLKVAGLAWEGLSHRLYNAVNPAIDATAKAFTLLMESANTKGIEDAMRDFAAEISRASISIVGDLQKVIDIFTALNAVGQPVADLLNKLNAGATAFGQAAHDVITGHHMGVSETHDTAGSASLDRTSVVTNFLNTNLASTGTAADELTKKLKQLAGVTDITVHKPNMPQMDLGGGRAGREAISAAMQDSQAEVDAAKEAAKQIETVLDGELRTHAITMQQWLTQTKDALGDEAQDVEAAYARELKIAGLTSAQVIEIKRREATALAEIARQITQAENKAAEASAAEWQKVSSAITGAVNSQIHGLLAGTESFGTAAKNVLAQLTERFVTFGVDVALNWALTMSGMKAAVTAFNTALGPLLAAGSATSAAAMKPGALAAIGVDSGEALMGFTAFFAPTLGPGAFAAAQGLTAAASAQAMGLASADVGGYVLSGGLAMLHSNETILPAHLSQPYQGGGNTFAPTINVTGNGGTQEFFNGAASQIARVLQNYGRLNPSTA